MCPPSSIDSGAAPISLPAVRRRRSAAMRRRQSSPHRAVPASTGGRQLQAAALSTPAPPPSHDPLQFKGGWFELLSNWTDFSTSTLEVKNGIRPAFIPSRPSRCFVALALPPLFAWHLSVLISVPDFSDGTFTIVPAAPAREAKSARWERRRQSVLSGPFAGVCAHSHHVRFAPKNEHRQAAPACPFCANCGSRV